MLFICSLLPQTLLFYCGFPRHFEFARLPRSFSTLGSEPKDARSALVCLSSGGADLDFKAGTQP